MRDERAVGAAYAAAAFTFWGLSPLYWRLVRDVPGLELLAHRVVWAAPLLGLLVARRRRLAEVGAALRHPGHRRLLLATAVLVAVNWLGFLWAVQRDLVLQASLGYYVNPLVNVLLGYLFLGERLSRRQAVAVLLAGAGVLGMTVARGTLPWIALLLAGTFGVYGLLRKKAGVDALVGLAAETALLAPLGVVGLAVAALAGASTFRDTTPLHAVLVVGAGAVTVVPLLWFANAARRLRYATIGFFQYLAPTLQFLLAVLAFGEPFSRADLLAFALIWGAVVLYLFDAARGPRIVGGSPLSR